VKARALFLSRLFKVEFIYRVGATFDAIFADTVEKLERTGHVVQSGGMLSVAPEAHARPELEFLADLVRDYLESYLLAVQSLRLVADGKVSERKAFVKAALDAGRAEFQAGRLTVPEALGKVTLENAVEYLVDQKLLVEENKQLKAGPAAADAEAQEARAAEIRVFLRG
jgi:glycerol-3-phosphate O-acyltransferase